jgi:hypothetical protein
MLTFGEFKNGPAKRIAGVCASSSDFQDLTNEATRKLMTRGNFWGTVQTIQVCVQNNCVVWPRFVETLLATNNCRGQSTQANFWFRFLPMSQNDWGGVMRDFQAGRCGGNMVMESTGTSPVSRNLPCGRQFYLRVYAQVLADLGKTITIFGKDQNGQDILTLQGGVLQPGVVLTIAKPFAVTPVKLSLPGISRVVKDVTQGPIHLFWFDSDNNVMLDCASYNPQEIAPDYLTSKIAGCGIQNPATHCSSIEALVKLQFIPVVNDNDMILFDNVEAIKMMIMSIKKQDAGENDAARQLDLDAIRESNYQLKNKFPIESFECAFSPYGTAHLSKVTGGFI